jgi:hypothetical protein
LLLLLLLLIGFSKAVTCKDQALRPAGVKRFTTAKLVKPLLLLGLQASKAAAKATG